MFVWNQRTDIQSSHLDWVVTNIQFIGGLHIWKVYPSKTFPITYFKGSKIIQNQVYVNFIKPAGGGFQPPKLKKFI